MEAKYYKEKEKCLKHRVEGINNCKWGGRGGMTEKVKEMILHPYQEVWRSRLRSPSKENPKSLTIKAWEVSSKDVVRRYKNLYCEVQYFEEEIKNLVAKIEDCKTVSNGLEEIASGEF